MSSAQVAWRGALAICVSAGLTGAQAAGVGSLKFPDASLEPSAWSWLDGWTSDDHVAALATFLTSCRAISQGKPEPAARRFIEAMEAVCRRALAARPLGEEEARVFFEKNFQPLHIAKMGDPEGFLMANLLGCEAGRVYLLLAHASGRLR